MNCALPPGDRGHRNAVSLGSSRSAGVVPGTLGLVGRAWNPPKRRTPPEMNPAARRSGNWRRSGFYRVIALAVLTLGRCDGQTHLLADRPRQEPAYRMRELGIRQNLVEMTADNGYYRALGCIRGRPRACGPARSNCASGGASPETFVG